MELIAAVQKCGEGNWASILKGDFKHDRTPSQLSQVLPPSIFAYIWAKVDGSVISCVYIDLICSCEIFSAMLGK